MSPFVVLVDDERIDDLDELVLAQPIELGCDLAGEVGLGEPEHQHLYRANGHSALPSAHEAGKQLLLLHVEFRLRQHALVEQLLQVLELGDHVAPPAAGQRAPGRRCGTAAAAGRTAAVACRSAIWSFWACSAAVFCAPFLPAW